MANTQVMQPGAVTMFEAGEKDLARLDYPFVRFRGTVLAFTIMCMVIGIGFALYLLLVAWQTGDSRDWNEFWNSGFTFLRFSPILLAARKGFWDDLSKAPERIRTARLAARSADDVLAPPTQARPEQPEPLDIAQIGYSSGRELTLRRPRGTTRDALGVFGWTFIVLGAIPLGIGAIMLVVSVSASRATDIPMAASMLAFSGCVLCGAGGLLVWMGKRLAYVTVKSDDFGIAWRYGSTRGKWQRIEWSQALAFVTLSCRSTSSYQRRHLYGLDTAAGVLCWEERDQARWEQTVESTARQSANVYLRWLITDRTGLPLRDISAALEPAKAGQTEQPAKSALKLPLGPPGSQAHLPVDRLFVETAPPVPTRLPRIVRAERFMLASLSVLTLMLYAGGWSLQHYQPQYYTGLLAKVHAAQPLYHDALAFEDGDWPERKSSNNDPTATQFMNGSYHLSSVKDSFAEINGPGIYGDAAIEVTVRHYGTSDDAGAGLAIRADDGDYEMMTFTVNAIDGTWAFWHFHYLDDKSDDDWSAIQWDQPSDAIHRGEGAANTLFVIVRGDTYLCYINGHYVGLVKDNSIQPPRGHVGLYVNDGATTGVFTNIAVYPAPPQSFLI